MLLPLDTGKYLHAMGRYRQFKKLIKSSVYNYFIIGLVFFLEPMFGLLLFCLYLGMAWVFHSFIFSWHGFHDATKPYDVVASNNSTGHYGHHKAPGMHLFSPNLRQQYEVDSATASESFPVHQSGFAFDVISRNWLLIQCLLWQKNYRVIRSLVRTNHLNDDDLKNWVKGLQLGNKHRTIAAIDSQVSSIIGATLAKLVFLIAPPKHRAFLQNSDV